MYRIPTANFRRRKTSGKKEIRHINVSIVIPLFNELDNIEPLYNALKKAADELNRVYEIIFIDDGSTDGTFSLLKDIQQSDRCVRVLRLGRNYGQTAAFSSGFDAARGDIIVTMDGDLQNDPADIHRLLEKTDVGYDVVSGWRVNRKVPFLTRRLPSMIANKLISRVTGVHLHDYGCSLKAYRRDVIKKIRLYGEMHRFIPALASWSGVQVAEVPVYDHPRKFGRSKYGLGRTIRVILDLFAIKFLLDYSTRPIQIFGFLGLLSLAGGLGLGLYLAVQRLFYNMELSDRPILLLSVILIVVGAQTLLMGLLAELLVRTYYESQNKPIYSIRESLSTEIYAWEDETEPAAAD